MKQETKWTFQLSLEQRLMSLVLLIYWLWMLCRISKDVSSIWLHCLVYWYHSHYCLTSSCFLRLASASFLASSAISSLMSRICLWRRLFCSFSRISLLLRWSRSSVSFSKFSLSRAKWLCQQQREMVRDRDWNYKYIDMACKMGKIWCIVMVVKVTFKRNGTNQVSHWCAKNPPPKTCCSCLGTWYHRKP